MNNKVKFVIWMFLALTLLDIYAHIPSAHPGCQGDISVFLKKNRNRRWEERSMVLGVRSLLFTVTGDHQVLKAPWGYFYIFSITVLFLFCQDRGWKLHNSHHTCKWPKGLQRAVCYKGTSEFTNPLLSVGFSELEPIQVRHQSGGHWQLLNKVQLAEIEANPNKSWDPVLSGQHGACGHSLAMAKIICMGYKFTFFKKNHTQIRKG